MSSAKRRAAHFLLTVLLVAAGALGFKALSETRQDLKRQKPEAVLPGVRVVPASSAAGPVVIRGEGSVAPLRQVNLVPQVGGEVVHVSPSLVNGGAFDSGELLVRIDPEDYRLAVTLARAKVEDAESKLQTLQAESAAAQPSTASRSGPSQAARKSPSINEGAGRRASRHGIRRPR